jgi:hypothetical protein
VVDCVVDWESVLNFNMGGPRYHQDTVVVVHEVVVVQVGVVVQVVGALPAPGRSTM